MNPEAGRPGKKRATSPSGWTLKTLAGVIGGFGLGIAASGLLACLSPGSLDAPNKFQVAMWLVPPVWIGAMSVCFVFRSAARAWLWLGGANALGFSMLALARLYVHH